MVRDFLFLLAEIMNKNTNEAEVYCITAVKSIVIMGDTYSELQFYDRCLGL